MPLYPLAKSHPTAAATAAALLAKVQPVNTHCQKEAPPKQVQLGIKLRLPQATPLAQYLAGLSTHPF